jgi:hypothetical protein
MTDNDKSILNIQPEFRVTNMDKHIIKIAQRGMTKDITDWSGKEQIYMLFYLYLLEKYNKKCFLQLKKEYGGGGLSGSIITIDYTDHDKTSSNDIIKKHSTALSIYAKQVAECINKNQSIILIPVLLIWNKRSHSPTHANVLIYNSNFKTFSLFEPFGTIEKYQKSEYKIFNYFISEINKHIPSGKKTHYEPSYVTCPSFFPMQRLEHYASTMPKDKKIESGGYCVIWSLFFSELVLLNPEKTTKQIYSDIRDYILNIVGKETAPDYLRWIARGYVKIVNEKLNKYFNTLFDTNMDTTQYIKFIKETPPDTLKLYNKIFTIYISIMYELQRTTIDRIHSNYSVFKAIYSKSKPSNSKELKNVDDKKNYYTIALNIIEKIKKQELLKNVTPLNVEDIQHKSNLMTTKRLSDKINTFNSPIYRRATKKKTDKEKPPCKPGKERNENGRCVTIKNNKTTTKNTTAKNTTAKNTTAKNTTAKNTTAKNTTAKNTTAKKNTDKEKPPCKPGKERNENGRCVTIKNNKTTTKNTTAKNTTAKKNTDKEKPPCKPGKERNENGRCVTIKNNKTTTKNTTAKKNTDKEKPPCKPGKERNENGRCVTIKNNKKI